MTTNNPFVQSNGVDFSSGGFFDEAFEVTMDTLSERIDVEFGFTAFDACIEALNLSCFNQTEIQNREVESGLQLLEAELTDSPSNSSIEVENREAELGLQLLEADMPDFSANSLWMNNMSLPVTTILPETLSSATTPSPPSRDTREIRIKMTMKQMIIELKDDYLVPSWVMEGKRIQASMLGDAALRKRKVEDKEDFMEGHKPMSKATLQLFLQRCRQGPKLDTSLDTLYAIFVELRLLTPQQWALFEDLRRTGRTSRRNRRR